MCMEKKLFLIISCCLAGFLFASPIQSQHKSSFQIDFSPFQWPTSFDSMNKEDIYCGPLRFSDKIEPITKVIFNDLQSVTPVENTVSHLMYLDRQATIERGADYVIRLQGNTNGDVANRFIVFIDWNQDGEFSGPEEIIPIQQLLRDSNGTDGKEVSQTMTIPENAVIGKTRMRIKKMLGGIDANDPCKGTWNGQAHDYTLEVFRPNQTTYCIPELNCENQNHIARVELAGIDQSSSCGTNGYSDFTHLSPAQLTGHTSVPISVTLGNLDHPSLYLQRQVNVWIDYNDNGLFEPGEMTVFPIQGDDKKASGYLQIPADVPTANYRMRIQYRVSPAINIQIPVDISCMDIGTWGETEDYTVHIQAAVCNQEIPANNFEGASYFKGERDQRLAVDFYVQAGKKMIPTQFVLNHAGTANQFQLKFYTTDPMTGLVGNLIGETSTTIVRQERIGSRYGQYFYTSTLQLLSPIVLQADQDTDTSYWVEVVSDAISWESTKAMKLGRNAAYQHRDTDNQWRESESEMVFAILGDCTQLGIQENLRTEITAYPNPVEDVLVLKALKSIEQIAVFNLSGKQVHSVSQRKIDQGKRVELQMWSLPTGIYIVRASIDGQTKTFKIIKR